MFIHLPALTHPQYDAFDVHLDRLLRGKLMLKDAVVTPRSGERARDGTSDGTIKEPFMADLQSL